MRFLYATNENAWNSACKLNCDQSNIDKIIV